MSTSSRRPRRKFTPEFKAEAVAMVEASGGQIARVAREQAAGAPTAQERAEIREGGPDADQDGTTTGYLSDRVPGK